MKKEAENVIYIGFWIFFLLVHAGLLLKHGIFTSGDFLGFYEPSTRLVLQWVQGHGEFPEIQGYKFTHINFIFFISLIYFTFGEGNRLALVVVQILIASFSYIYLLRFMMRNFESKVACLFILFLAVLFYDNIMWNFYCSPESLYRSLFVISFLYMLNLYSHGRSLWLIGFSIISFVVLVMIRFDTVILFLPVYLMILATLFRQIQKQEKQPVLWIGVAFIAFCGFIVLWHIELKWFVTVMKLICKAGWVLGDVDKPIQIENFDFSREKDAIYIGLRLLKLFFLRIYYLINIYDHPFWSRAHSIYYGVFMSFFSVFFLVGVIYIWKENNKQLFFVFLIPFASVILHGIYMTESSLRQNYTPLLFLILISGYGFDKMYQGFLGQRIRNQTDRFLNRFRKKEEG